MKYTNNGGFSLIIAMGMMLLLSLIGLYLMEYMIPFSRSIKGIENASQAFYESYGGVEESALKVYNGTIGTSYNKTFTQLQDYEYNFIASGNTIPAVGEGNIPLDTNYSRFSQSEPISIEVGNGRFQTSGESINLFLQLPDGVGFAVPYTDEIILLQLSGAGGSLSSASGALIRESDVNLPGAINILSENGVTLTGQNRTFRQYFSDLGCENIVTRCILKASVIRPLLSSSGDAIIPYLKYRLETSKPIPYPNPLVTSKGKSYGFSKTLEVFIPQQATSSAFDFTVLQ